MTSKLFNNSKDQELRSMRIETTSIYPRSINDSVTGGSAHFVFPQKGVPSADTSIIIPCTCTDPGYQFPVNAGVFSIIDRAVLSCGGQLIDEVSPANELLTMLNMTVHPERKMNLHSVLHGINYVMETGSGSKLDANEKNMQALPGQYRLVADQYHEKKPSQNRIGRNNQRPYLLNATQSLKLSTDVNTTPAYSIRLSDLFPGLFQDGQFRIPAGMLVDEVVLDINFSRDGKMQYNERAVFMPNLSNKTKDSLKLVAVTKVGDTGNAGDNFTDVILKHVKTGANDDNKGARLLVDIVAGKTTNVRILDGGRGYTSNDVLTFDTVPSTLTTTQLECVEGSVLNDKNDVNNFYVSTGGQGFEVGKDYTFQNADGATFVLTAVTVDAGNNNALQTVDARNSVDFDFKLYEDKAFSYTPSGGTQAVVYPVKTILDVTCTDAPAGKKWSVGDIVQKNANTQAIVAAVDVDANENKITQMREYLGTFANADALQKNGDVTTTCTLTTIDDVEETVATKAGLGLDPLFNFDNYDANGNVLDDAKIKIHTPGVFLQTDILYFMDGSEEEMQQKMMSPEGIPHTYTSFINTTSTISDKNTVTAYGQKQTVQVNRLLGLANSTVRSMMWYLYNTGNHKTDSNAIFPYYEQQKFNPLLNKYHARSSLAMDGIRYNININSIPYYANQCEADLRKWVELSKCHGPFYVNKGQYSGWNQCRSLDNPNYTLSNANPSKQPGFCDLDDATKATAQYEINERKAAICNQSYEGVNQAFLRGMGHYMGISFKTTDKNVMGNGIPIGETPVDMNIEIDNTFDPWYSGECNLTVFSEVERRLAFKNGYVELQTASF